MNDTKGAKLERREVRALQSPDIDETIIHTLKLLRQESWALQSPSDLESLIGTLILKAGAVHERVDAAPLPRGPDLCL